MPNATPNQDRSQKDFFTAEVRRVFEKPESPRYPFPLSDAVDCLFDILHHSLGDHELDAVGSQILHAIANYRDGNDFLNLPDRLEAFLKFTQRLLKSATPAMPAGTPSRERMFLPEVLQAFGLANASTVGTQPLAQFEGKPRFAWHVERAVQARNEVHRAPSYSAREKAEIFESVCVVMLFTICELKEKIGLALLASAQRRLLEHYRDNFDKWRERFVELEGQEQVADEFEGIDPLAVEILDETEPAQDDSNEAQDAAEDPPPNPQLPEQRRGLVRDLVRTVPKLVLLGDPGAGKTTTLQYLAWQMASGLLKNPSGDWWFPIYLPLKTFSSSGSLTIAAAIQAETESVSFNQLAKQRCLFLLDGLNEVPQEHLLAAKHQIQSLLSLGDNIRVVMTCRPGQFQNEFGLPVFELQPLKDEQIRHFFQRHLRDTDKVQKLMVVVKHQPKLWEWARNPFMLAMLVRVFLKNGNLPENRGNLMKAFLGDIMRREQAQGAARIPLETKTTLLARLAFETRKLALLSFTRLDAYAWIKQRRDELGSILDVPLFVDELLNNNLLAKTTGELLTFDHELYQEYFCAVSLLEMGDRAIAMIEELQREPRWEEPIIIYSGICDCRSSLLRALALVNVHLAAKSLTSAAVDEISDRDIIILKSKELATQATDPLQVAEGLLSLAELGEAEAMITVLKQRGAQDATARQAIQSFIPKCPPDLVVGWIQRTSDLSVKFLITWMLAAITPDQKESLQQDHRDALKDLFLWQARRTRQTWKGKAERNHLHRLLKFLDPEFRTWLARSLIKDILSRVDYGGDDQWVALMYLGQAKCELGSSANWPALVTAALNYSIPSSIAVAVLIWSQYPSDQDFSFIFQSIPEGRIKNILRQLRQTRAIDYYRFSLLLAETLHLHLVSLLIDNPRLVQTSTARLEFLGGLKIGQVCRNCRVTSLTEFGGFVELEPGHDALLHSADMSWNTLQTHSLELKVNQRMDVVVLEIDDAAGHVLVGLKQMVFALWDAAQSKYPVGTKTQVKVLAVNDENALVALDDGVEGIIGRSELSWSGYTRPKDILAVGQQLEAIVCGVDNFNFRFSLSIRLLETNSWEEIEKLYPVGSIVSGKVINLVNFGAFVCLPDGTDALLHITDMSWGRLKHPSEMVKLGDTVEVMVLEIDSNKKHISLGLKQKQPNPWDDIVLRLPVGSKVHGRVVSVVPYGAFVQIEEGIEGMVHVSEISWTERVVKASDVLKVGDAVETVVLEIKPDEQKISLSLRQLEPSPWAHVPKKYPPGTKVTGRVRNLTNFGAFVELEAGIEGMIHVSDMSWTHKVTNPSEIVKKDQTVDAVVIEVDSANRRMSLSLKQLTEDPWPNIDQHYKLGDLVKGKVIKLASFGAFVELAGGFEGLVHISQICEERIEKAKEILKVGDEVTACVIQIDSVERRIGLSMKTTGSGFTPSTS